MEAVMHCCEICGQEGLRDEEMRTHMLLMHIEGAISCPFCDLSDISADEMFLHVNSVHLDYLTPDDEYKSMLDGGASNPRILIDGACASAGRSSSGGNANYLANLNRPQLSLNLHPSRKPQGGGPACVVLSTPVDKVTRCPMCGLAEPSPTKLQEHINRQHFDLTSPSFPDLSPLDHDTPFTCPLCVRNFESSNDLEWHVNVEHRDVLSPARITPADENSNERCPVCSHGGFRSAAEMAAHIEEHFEKKGAAVASPEVVVTAQEIEKKEKEARKLREQREFELLQAQYGMDNHGSFREQSLANMQRAVYAGEMSVSDYYNRQVELKLAEQEGTDDGHSCTKGLIPKIKAVSVNSNNVVRTWMCTTVDHYGSTYGDRGWGCGYRNMQMLLSSLLHHTGYNSKLFNGKNTMPAISKIQSLIEAAWRMGFDAQGCEQLGGKLFNTRKWIGATEVVTFLCSFRIRVQLLDFHVPSAPDGGHPALFQWVLDYFQKQEEFKPPIYLQHQGHSRTIIGCEQMKDGAVRLLVLDPSHNKLQMEQFNSTAMASNAIRLLRRPLQAMKARQYQMVVIAGLMETEQEFQQSKVLKSTLIPPDN